MSNNRPALFRGRHFEDPIIILCVRWYLRYSLSYRDLRELMAERGLSVDHTTVWRWAGYEAMHMIRKVKSGGWQRTTWLGKLHSCTRSLASLRNGGLGV
jgi:transposase-like protein